MNIEKLSIKQIKDLMVKECNEELLTAIKNDARKGVQSIYKSYQREMKERQRVANLYTFENECRANGYKLIAGVDEVGRGPLAGPVVVASVILLENFFIEKINDSKKLSEATREKMNGMYEAIYGLNPKPDAVLIDAMPLESLDIYHQSIIKGDAKSASIAAASIVAKVERDRMMNEFDKIYPQYGFAKNKGYGTSEHLEALRKYGPCEIHRKSFEPIKSMVMQK